MVSQPLARTSPNVVLVPHATKRRRNVSATRAWQETASNASTPPLENQLPIQMETLTSPSAPIPSSLSTPMGAKNLPKSPCNSFLSCIIELFKLPVDEGQQQNP